MGAVLSQSQDDGRVHPIAYASPSLDIHEKNYGVTELETLALVWAVRYFCAYLLGHRTTVFMDHSACMSLLNHPRPSGKLARWALTIQDMDFVIKYRSGRSNTNADALSRNPVSIFSHTSESSAEIMCTGKARKIFHDCVPSSCSGANGESSDEVMCTGKARKISHNCVQSACNGVTADAHAVHVASSTPVEQSAADVSRSETQSIESIPKPTHTSLVVVMMMLLVFSILVKIRM